MIHGLHQHVAAISDRLENWWLRGEQANPVLLITTPREVPAGVPQTGNLQTWWSDPEFVVRMAMALIDSQEYSGAAVPYHYVHLGAGSMAPLLGASIDLVSRDECIVRPRLQQIEDVIDLAFDPRNSNYRCIRDMIARSSSMSIGHHYVAPFTLGGLADTAAGLYGAPNLALDMIDQPSLVHRAFGRLRQFWMELFDDFQRVIASGGNPGCISRLGVWAPGSTLCIREDFARMISTDAFRRFCLPNIADMLSVTDWPSFLLTRGSLRHLDAILELTDLNVIQWQPAPDGQRLAYWYDLIRHILGQGKAIQLTAQADEVDDLVRAVGPRGLLLVIRDATLSDAEELLDRYGDE